MSDGASQISTLGPDLFETLARINERPAVWSRSRSTRSA